MRERLQEGIWQKENAEKSLRENEEKYRQIYNAPSEAIFICDAKTGAIQDVNQTMLDMYGYSRKEVLELNITELCDKMSFNPGEETWQRLQGEIIAGNQLLTKVTGVS